MSLTGSCVVLRLSAKCKGCGAALATVGGAVLSSTTTSTLPWISVR